jgi:hypothetical protein
MKRFLVPALTVLLASATSGFGQPSFEYGQLPNEVRTHIREIQNSCKELDPDKAFNDMDGIEVVTSKAMVLTTSSLTAKGFVGGAICLGQTAPIAAVTCEFTRKPVEDNGSNSLMNTCTPSFSPLIGTRCGCN